MKVVSTAAVLICLCAGAVRADFSYQQKTEITGGALAGMMKFASAFSKQAREPMLSHVYVKGHRLAHVNAHSTQITDLDKETITNINLDRKTYSVMTFEQMKQQFEQMSKEVQEKKADKDINMNMNVSAKNTGQSKEIDGLTAKELVMTMTVQGTDPKTGQTGGMDIRSDMWMAKVPGYDEVRDVYKLMGEKLGFVMGGTNFLPMQRPDMVKNMGEMYKEMGKLEGMPVETMVAMGGSGTPGSAATPTAASSSANSGEASKSPTANDAAVAAAMSQLGGLAGGFGHFGRKKKKSDDSSQQSASQQTDASTAASPESGASGSLIEMTTRSSDFSTAPVDDSHFAVPDGFKQVEPDTNRRGR